MCSVQEIFIFVNAMKMLPIFSPRTLIVLTSSLVFDTSSINFRAWCEVRVEVHFVFSYGHLSGFGKLWPMGQICLAAFLYGSPAKNVYTFFF
jgi:hypothetical protein